LAMEEIAKVDASVAVIMSVNNSLVCYGLNRFGNEEQKHKYLKSLASGKTIGAFLLSEPEAGSDATHQHTSAEDKGDYYLLNGTKNWITNAHSASTYIVMAQTHPEKKHRGINAFIVDKNTPGITLGPHENKMGMRSSDTHSVMFTDVKVPKENRLGEDGFGFKFAMIVLEAGRIGIASQALGIAQGAYESALEYAHQRRQFGKPISSFQAIQHMLADMATQIEAARALIYQTAKMIDAGVKSYAKESAMCKLYASDTAMKVATDAIQVFGGYGYMKEYPVEKMFRDAKITQIYEGTNQIQRNVIALELIKGLAKKKSSK